MNEKNVAALKALLEALHSGPDDLSVPDDREIGTTWGGGPLYYADAHKMAKWLASRGVLVPSALTTEDVLDELCWGAAFPTPGDWKATEAREDVRQAFVTELARIAKGEDT